MAKKIKKDCQHKWKKFNDKFSFCTKCLQDIPNAQLEEEKDA